MAILRGKLGEEQLPAGGTNRLFTGDPIEDMEIAKALIAKHPDVDLDPLIAIAADRQQPISARIAAIYTLGMTDDHGRSRSTLTRLANDQGERPEIKDHAEEALGYVSSR
jgi:hypothetical protein